MYILVIVHMNQNFNHLQGRSLAEFGKVRRSRLITNDLIV
jgi:hypothetical protein